MEIGGQIVSDGFTALEAMPQYYQYTLGTIVAASFGMRGAAKFFARSDVKAPSKDSQYDQYDMDGDGIVTDEELEHAKEIKKTEYELRKQLAQRRMATATLIAMGVFTFMMFMPFISIERINALSDISNLFYISGAGIVGAFMGATAWMNRK